MLKSALLLARGNSRQQQAKMMVSTLTTSTLTSTSRATTLTTATRTAQSLRPSKLRAALSSSAAAADSTSSQSVKRTPSSRILSRRPIALLERHVSGPSPSSPSSSSSSPPTSSPDLSLWESGAFRCEVYPDLPVAASWRGLLRAATGGLVDSAVDATAGDAPGVRLRRRRRRREDEDEGEEQERGETFVVRTVAAQVRGIGSVRDRIQRAAGVSPDGTPLSEAGGNGDTTPSHSPDALLLVSGGHPARTLFARTDSLEMLRVASDMRSRGLLPRDLELWCVANPLIEDPRRAGVEKAEAGADAVVAQPPLSRRAWLRWWEGLREISSSSSSSTPSVPPVIGGVALPNTPGALRFWVALCGASRVEGVGEELAAFDEAAAAAAAAPSSSSSSSSKTLLREHALSYARRTLSFYESLSKEGGDDSLLAGIHVMPVTGPGREIARRLLEEGAFAQWDQRGRRRE